MRLGVQSSEEAKWATGEEKPYHGHQLGRAASGHGDTAPPSSVMNSRRFIQSPRRRERAAAAALLLRLGLRDLRDQLLNDGVAEGIEVLRDRDECAGAANDVVAIVVCKPARRGDVARIEMGWRLCQDDEPVDRDALSDRYIPRRSRLAARIVVAIPRNIDHAPVRFVGCLIELGDPEVDPGADRCGVSSERARRLHDAIPELTCRLIVADHRPIDYDLLLQNAGPFDERSGDAPSWAAAKGLNHPRVGESRRISRTLQLEF